MPSCLHYANGHHASVLCLPSLNDTQFMFYGKTFDSQAPIKSKAGPYMFVAALEATRLCLVKEINFKINIAHKINVTLYSLRALRFTMHFV